MERNEEAMRAAIGHLRMAKSRPGYGREGSESMRPSRDFKEGSPRKETAAEGITRLIDVL